MDMKVCPECKTTDYWVNNDGVTGPSASSEYGCSCGARFNELSERDRQGEWTASTHGLAKELEEADPNQW